MLLGYKQTQATKNNTSVTVTGDWKQCTYIQYGYISILRTSTWWSSAMLEPLGKVAGPLTKALILGSYFCKTFVMISLVLLDLYDTLQFWVFIGEGWGGNDTLNKIAKIRSNSIPVTCTRMSWPNLVKIGHWKADGMSYGFDDKKVASWDASELPILTSQSWSHPITCVFQLVGGTSHSVFVVRNVCIPVNVFTHVSNKWQQWCLNTHAHK